VAKIIVMRRTAVTLIACFALAACGGGASDPAGHGRGPDGSPDSLASPGASAGTGAPSGPGVPAAPGTVTLPPEATARPSDFPVPDFVKAEVPEDEAWGSACFVPRVGSACRVPFEGVAYLSTQDKAQIALVAYENKSTTPAAIRLLPAEKGPNRLCFESGCPHGGAWLSYVPSPGTKTVTFFVELRATGGAVLAKSFPKAYRIH